MGKNDLDFREHHCLLWTCHFGSLVAKRPQDDLPCKVWKNGENAWRQFPVWAFERFGRQTNMGSIQIYWILVVKSSNIEYWTFLDHNHQPVLIQFRLCWKPLQPWMDQEALHRFNAESTRCAKQTTKGVDDGPMKTLVILNSNHPCLQLQVMIIHGVITCYHQTHVSF